MKILEQEDINTYFVCLVHDLKTPLLAQQKILDLFLNNTFGQITPVQREVLLEFQKSEKYLMNMVSDMLSSYLYENNQVKLKKEIFAFSEFLEEIISENSVLSDEKQIYSDIKSALVFADKSQIKRAVINLISNAIKYSCKNSEILIKSEIKDNEMIFSITNKSSYLLPKDMENFFEKFRTNNPYDSGLGLYIVKQIIKAHEGSTFVKTGKDNTCTFGFKVPIVVSF